MDNFIERIKIFSVVSSLSWLFLTYNIYSQIVFITIGLILIYGELIYGLYHSAKLCILDLIILSLMIVLFYLHIYSPRLNSDNIKFDGIYYILCLILISRNRINVIIFYVFGLLWTFPSIYILINYIITNPYIFISHGAIVWSFDAGAYIFGKLLGKNKLAPTISPNKTIEGTVCGILTSVLVGYAIFYQKYDLDYLVLSLIYGVFGQIGDLIESVYKRWVDLKDSSSIFGGAGGVNDKFDSLYIAIPVGYLYIMLRNLSL